jgi:cyclopropane fatty-acyl-phospholipid synthase-like methyltransferase
MMMKQMTVKNGTLSCSIPESATNAQAHSFVYWVDQNTIVWWCLILVSVFLAVAVSPWGCLFWMLALAVDDVLMYGFGKSILFDSQLRVRRNYQWMHNMYDNTTGSGRDLGFNLVVEDDLSQRAKYEHMVNELRLEKGMVICDIGCGYGDWLKYCRDEVGCEVLGINMSPEQAHYAEYEYGLQVIVTNWKSILSDAELQQKLCGKFDAITFMDTVEHYVSMEDRCNLEKQTKIYSDMCLLASKLLNKNSKSSRVFMSCLHQTRKPRTWRFYFHSYFMDKFYSGYYPFVDEGPIKVCEPWFDVIKVDDKTEDYRLTGVRDNKHFQTVKIKLTPKKIVYFCMLLLLDPHAIHRLLYCKQDSWMYFYGDNAYDNNYDLEYRKKVSYVLLFWVTFELRKTRN